MFDTTMSDRIQSSHGFFICVIVVGSIAITICGLLTWQVHTMIRDASQAQTDRYAFMQQYVGHRNFACSADQYSNDMLLRKINPQFAPLPEQYIPDNLVAVPNRYLHPASKQQLVRSDVLPHVVQLLDQARAEGIDIRLNSAYRSYQTQQQWYRSASVGTPIEHPEWIAKPGYSEHQLGSTIDVSQYPNENKQGYDWLKNNAFKYGFVLSYPQNMNEITGYDYEPWHWRYTGDTIASYIHNEQLLFNHQAGLLLPSPLREQTELPYEYQGQDIWVWKYLTPAVGIVPLITGEERRDFFANIPDVLEHFDTGVVVPIVGGIPSAGRNWIIVRPNETYIDRVGNTWTRTSLASAVGTRIDNLEILYRKAVGYVIISYNNQTDGDRLVGEFAHSCGLR